MGNSPLRHVSEGKCIQSYHRAKKLDLIIFHQCNIIFTGFEREAFICISTNEHRSRVINIVGINKIGDHASVQEIYHMNRPVLTTPLNLFDNKLTLATIYGPLVIKFKTTVSANEICDSLTGENNSNRNECHTPPRPPLPHILPTPPPRLSSLDREERRKRLQMKENIQKRENVQDLIKLKETEENQLVLKKQALRPQFKITPTAPPLSDDVRQETAKNHVLLSTDRIKDPEIRQLVLNMRELQKKAELERKATALRTFQQKSLEIPVQLRKEKVRVEPLEDKLKAIQVDAEFSLDDNATWESCSSGFHEKEIHEEAVQIDLINLGASPPSDRTPPAVKEAFNPYLYPRENKKKENVRYIGRASDVRDPLPPDLKDVEIFYKADLSNETFLTRGGQGAVSIASTKFFPKVAVKHFVFSSHYYQEYNKRELINLMSLRPHPHVIEYRGILYKDPASKLAGNPPIGYLMEYMVGGSVHNIIHEKPAHPYNAKHVLNWLRQAASGLCYLHKKNIIHRDVKPANMLLDKTRTVLKLCDFGLSSGSDNAYTADIGTLYYMAPEVLGSTDAITSYDTKCDVYSLGISVWEMVHRKFPYSETKRPLLGVINEVKVSNLRPIINPRICPSSLAEAIRKAWIGDVSLRSTMEDVFDYASSKLKEIKVEDDFDL